MMAESPIEEQEDVAMVSPTGGGDPFRKKAFFLKPSVPPFIDGPHFKLPKRFASLPSRFEPRKWPLGVEFHGWRQGQQDWNAWVDRLAPIHQSTWKKAGIYEAIFNSKYQIRRNTDMLYEFAEKWCSDTNTFIFPWGEATITLEDVMVLGGFSVSGVSIFSPLGSCNQLRKVEEKLIEARKQVRKVRASKWLNKFVNSGSELEHEAFLAFWLSRYAFHDLDRSIQKRVFPIAIHLARGTRIALAPAVLASIYNDLRLLKNAIVALNELKTSDGVLNLHLKSPFQLVQVWAWERFLELRPVPNVINYGEPRLARWNKINGLKVENLRRVLDSSGDAFVWRPYAMAVDNWSFPKYYLEKENRVLVGHGLEDDEELLSFSICLRVTELAGLDTRKQYLPHRVAMQFGYDQDIPCIFARSNVSRKHCIKKTETVRLYIPSRLSELDVSARYLKWWNESLLRAKQSSVPLGFPRKKDLEPSKVRKKISAIPLVISNTGRNESNDSLVLPGFSPKCSRMEAGDSMDEDDLNISEYLRERKKHKSVETRKWGSNSTAGESSVDIMMSERSVKEVMLSSTLIWGCKAKRNMKNVMGSNASTGDNEMVSTIGNGWASRVEKQVSELQATVKRLELVVDKLETQIRSWYQSITAD